MLEIDLKTMKLTTEQVEALQKLLVIKMFDVEKENERFNEIMEIVVRESLDIEKEQEMASVQQKDTQNFSNAAALHPSLHVLVFSCSTLNI